MKTDKQLIILIIIMVGFVSFLTGFLFTRPSISLEPNWQKANILERFSNDQPQESSVSIIPKGVFKISQGAVLNPTAVQGGDGVVFYDRQLNKIVQTNLITKEKKVLKEFNNLVVTKIVWSPKGNEILYNTQTKKEDAYFYSNLNSGNTTKLGPIISPVFSPDGTNLTYINIQGEQYDIVTAKSDGSSPRTVLHTRLANMALYWPTQNTVVIRATNQSTDEYELYTLSATGDLKKIYTNSTIFDLNWNASGSQALLSTNNTLAVLNLDGTTKPTDLSLRSSECTWTHDNMLLCAMAQNGETQLYKINTGDQSKKEVAGHVMIDPQSIFLSSLENFIVMISEIDQYLYGLEIEN